MVKFVNACFHGVCGVVWQMPMADIMGGMWMVFQPLLFGLIGAEVNFSDVKEATIGKSSESSAKS